MSEEIKEKEEKAEEGGSPEKVVEKTLEEKEEPETSVQAEGSSTQEDSSTSESASDTDSEGDEVADKEPEEKNPLGPYNSAHKWYVVHAYSGHEHVAKSTLENRILSLEKQNLVSEVLVPEETVVEIVKGKRKTSKRRFFPGYILIRMELNKESWHIIKSSPRIMGFVGDRVHPQTISEKEIQKMTNRISEGKDKPRPKISFTEGENVRVVDGPFLNFSGVVENVNVGKSKLRVLVSIFGRSTPVELDFVQVEKI